MKAGRFLLLLLLSLAILSGAGLAADDGIPLLPMQLYGTAVYDSGDAVEAGTVITATLDGTAFTYTLKEAGKIGSEGSYGEKFLVSSTATDGIISFSAGNMKSDATVTYEPGKLATVSLVFPAATPVPEEKEDPETITVEIPSETGHVILETTQYLTEVQIPPEIISAHPHALLKITESTKIDKQSLPSEVSAENVHLWLELSVVDENGVEIPVTASGYFLLTLVVDTGKELKVWHKKKSGIWEKCVTAEVSSDSWKVEYTSLSPFIVEIVTPAVTPVPEEKDVPAVTPEKKQETVTTEYLPETVLPEPVQTPVETTTTESRKSASSPFPVIGIIAGIGCAFYIRKKKNVSPVEQKKQEDEEHSGLTLPEPHMDKDGI